MKIYHDSGRQLNRPQVSEGPQLPPYQGWFNRFRDQVTTGTLPQPTSADLENVLIDDEKHEIHWTMRCQSGVFAVALSFGHVLTVTAKAHDSHRQTYTAYIRYENDFLDKAGLILSTLDARIS